MDRAARCCNYGKSKMERTYIMKLNRLLYSTVRLVFIAVIFWAEASTAHWFAHAAAMNLVQTTNEVESSTANRTATLKVTILSSDRGGSTPAMIQLLNKTEGRAYEPSNAIDLDTQFDQQAHWTWPRTPFYAPP